MRVRDSSLFWFCHELNTAFVWVLTIRTIKERWKPKCILMSFWRGGGGKKQRNLFKKWLQTRLKKLKSRNPNPVTMNQRNSLCKEIKWKIESRISFSNVNKHKKMIFWNVRFFFFFLLFSFLSTHEIYYYSLVKWNNSRGKRSVMQNDKIFCSPFLLRLLLLFKLINGSPVSV